MAQWEKKKKFILICENCHGKQRVPLMGEFSRGERGEKRESATLEREREGSVSANQLLTTINDHPLFECDILIKIYAWRVKSVGLGFIFHHQQSVHARPHARPRASAAPHPRHGGAGVRELVRVTYGRGSGGSGKAAKRRERRNNELTLKKFLIFVSFSFVAISLSKIN